MRKSKDDNSLIILVVCIAFLGLAYYLLFTIAKIIVWWRCGRCAFRAAIEPTTASVATVVTSGVCLLMLYFIGYALWTGADPLLLGLLAPSAIVTGVWTWRLGRAELRRIVGGAEAPVVCPLLN